MGVGPECQDGKAARNLANQPLTPIEEHHDDDDDAEDHLTDRLGRNLKAHGCEHVLRLHHRQDRWRSVIRITPGR
jgi:hypothetical protein